MHKQINVFIGVSDIAGLTSQYASGFRSIGCNVTTVSEFPRPGFHQTKFDIRLDKLGLLITGQKNACSRFAGIILSKLINRIPGWKKHIVTKKIIDHNDVFVFLWAQTSMLANKEDLRLIKERGKKIIYIFLGSDIRLNEAFLQQYPHSIHSYYKQTTTQQLFESKINNLRLAEWYADAVYSVPDQSGLQIRPYRHVFLPYKAITHEKKTCVHSKIKIIHCPSNNEIKGTSHIIKVVEQMKKEIDFDFLLLSGVSNTVVLEHLEQSDILIDEIVLHGPGMLAFEAMSRNCLVMTHVDKNNCPAFSPPVVNIDEYTLRDQLLEFISNQEKRNELIKQGVEWVKTHHAPDTVAQNMLNDIQNETSPYDYRPDFFHTQFLLPDYLTIPELSKNLEKKISEKNGTYTQ